MRILDKEGDAIGLQMRNIKELLDHLYNPSMCKEKQKEED